MLTYDQIERQIVDLSSEAAPLRLLSEDDPKGAGLAGIVDKINALRAEQSKLPKDAPAVAFVAPDAESPTALEMENFDYPSIAKPKLGRPAKVEA